MRVYLDHHATTPVDPRVLEAFLPYFGERFGNASSRTHPWGWEAQEAVETARREVARLIGASAREVVFTSGATESNHLALLGVTAGGPGRQGQIITQATEHHAVLDLVRQLEKRGFELTLVRPDREGFVDPQAVRDAITERTRVVSVMAANNEIGTLQPIADIAAVCREAGVLLHADAAQAVGRIPVDVEAWGVDLLSISAHKLYGPKGAGALYVRRRGRRVRLEPIAWGGGQEGGLRPGTLNVPGIVGLGAACRIAGEELEPEMQRIRVLRDRLLEAVRTGVPGVHCHGPQDPDRRLPGNLSLGFPGVDGTALLLALQDIAASSGSACTSGQTAPSHVLRAIGVSDDLAAASIRLCPGRFTTEEEVDFAAGRVVDAAGRLRLLPR